MPQLTRNAELEKALLTAVIAEEKDRPRTKQRKVGPSEIGGCTRLLQAKIFEDTEHFAEETEWHTAAFVGTVVGDALESIFHKRLGMDTQERITTELPRLGMSISGSMDLIDVEGNRVLDLKSIETIAKLHADGPKLSHCIQIGIYTLGAVQRGRLEEGATAVLVYYDRSGASQEFVCVEYSWDELMAFVAVGEERLEKVFAAQDALEAGDLRLTHELREYSPSFCFSRKVQCPLRFQCWGGSSWDSQKEIRDGEVYKIADRYIAGRDMEQAGKALKTSAKNELDGIEGRVITGDGEIMVGKDSRGYISVARVDRTPGKDEE